MKKVIILSVMCLFLAGCGNTATTVSAETASLVGNSDISGIVKESVKSKEDKVIRTVYDEREKKKILTLEGLPEDYVGSYNGTCFSVDVNDIAIFLNDGWEFKFYEDSYKTYIAALTKSSMPNVYLYVTCNDYGSTDKEVAVRIEQDGFYGYSIDVANASSKPNMTWSGLTWGATIEDIEAIYGTNPEYVYECDLYTALDYILYDNMFISFAVYNQNEYNTSTGLQGVDLNMYYNQ